MAKSRSNIILSFLFIFLITSLLSSPMVSRILINNIQFKYAWAIYNANPCGHAIFECAGGGGTYAGGNGGISNGAIGLGGPDIIFGAPQPGLVDMQHPVLTHHPIPTVGH